jgi:V/A-type H+-transporting ATPase subunit D
MVEPPQSRAGRRWLISRIATARRGAELLDRKRQLLQREQTRLALEHDATLRHFEEAFAATEAWSARAAVLGGQSELSIACSAVPERAVVNLTWRNSMGVLHPSGAGCSFPALPPLQSAAFNAALAPAAQAACDALDAAVAHAVADHAFRRVDAELSATTRRVRAIERRRLPALEDALRRVEQRLDEVDREERVVARWARSRQRQPTGHETASG